MSERIITLDDYQAANLIALIETIGYPTYRGVEHSPYRYLDTGDWIGEIYWKLVGLDGQQRPDKRPNKTPAEQVDLFNRMMGGRRSVSDDRAAVAELLTELEAQLGPPDPADLEEVRRLLDTAPKARDPSTIRADP